MHTVRSVILDVDGTLLLSNDAHARAFAEAATRLGIHADLKEIRRLIGKGGDKLIPEAFGLESESDLGRKLGDLKGDIFRKHYLPALQPAPGTRPLLTRFRGDGIRLVVASSAGKDEVRPLVERAGVSDLIEDMVSADDAEESKPDPDIVIAAIQRISAERDSTFMLGDTPYDVQAARRAGIRIIAVRCGGWDDRDLEGAVAVYDNPADVLTHYNHALSLI